MLRWGISHVRYFDLPRYANNTNADNAALLSCALNMMSVLRLSDTFSRFVSLLVDLSHRQPFA